jgi:hypothetical protein
MHRHLLRCFFALGLVLGAVATPVRALDVVGYTSTANDRFASGFPMAPVPNTAGGYIGLGYDWTGVGWSATDGTKGFGFLSPQHYLVAAHYGGAATLRLQQADGSLVSGTQQSVVNTGYGFDINGTYDMSVGSLTAPLANFSQIARYAVLDLNLTSSTDSLANYTNQPLIVYGRGTNGSSSPRVADSSVFSASSTLYNNPNNGYMITKTTTYTLQVGDSGSPAFITWTNPDGDQELTIIGNNAAVDTTNGNNLQSFMGRAAIMSQFNTLMNPDGFALRITGNPSNTWVGSTSQSINNRGAWGLSPPASAPSDRYVLFDAATAGGGRSVLIDSAANERGMFFKATAVAADGFSFSGASTLTIGRGGIVNYDDARQTISAPIALGSSQYWDVGPGGVTAGAIDTAGYLLEVAGSGAGVVSGNVSGAGGVALSGTRLELTGTSSYTGGTWVHSGRLVVDGSIAASSGVTVNAAGSVAGSGLVAAIAGSGSVDPGNSPGILTAPSVDPTGGLDFNFEFTQIGSPTWGNASASGNDVLRLQSVTTPFTSPLTAANAINIYLEVASLSLADTFRGAFFTDRDADFLGSISNATFNYFLADAGGTVDYNGVAYNLYAGPFTFDWFTVAETANFAGGSEAGYVGQFVVVPEPATWLLMVAAVAGAATVRSRRARPRLA